MNQPTPPANSPDELVPFLSLRSLQDTHHELRHKRPLTTPPPATFWQDVHTFLQRGEAAGAYLDSDSERQLAQSRLDYWYSELLKAGHAPPEAILIPFDLEKQPEIPNERCPYVGLEPFQEHDTHLFFGRQQQTNQLLKTLTLSRLATVVGSSGSGKSSLVLAGLLPRLRQGALAHSETWRYYGPIVPGSAPLTNLAQLLLPQTAVSPPLLTKQATAFRQNEQHLSELIEASSPETAVLIIDQFEETFTLCRDLEERTAFINNLLHLVRLRHRHHIVILTMRSDYESYVNKAPLFQSLYEQSIVRLTAMKASDLRSAIEEPAKLVGLRFEEGLIDELLREIVGEPAVLPLLQFTLMQLWEKRQRNYVTWDSYRQLGSSVLQALENTAETLYQTLPVEEQETARRILLRLVWPTEGVEATRNRIPRHTLYLDGEAHDRVDRVLDKLIQARLIHLTHGTRPKDDQVEVAHEALVRNWRRLIGWLEDERTSLRQRQRLALEARKWDTLQQDPGALLRGALLQEALTYRDLNELETAYVQASQAAYEQTLRAEEEAREQLLRRRTRFATIVTIFSIIAILFALFALDSSRNAENSATLAERNQATAVSARATAQTDANLRATAEREVSQQRDAAISARATAEANAQLARQSEAQAQQARATAEASAQELQTALAAAKANAQAAEAARTLAEAQSKLATARELAAIANEQLNSDPQLGLLLAIEAVNLTLHETNGVPTEAEETLYRALQASQLQATFSGHTDAITAVSFAPNGQLLATASRDTTIKLWATASGQEQLTLADHSRPVNTVAFSPDGRHLASGGDDGFVIIWDIERGERQHVLGSASAPILALAYSPNGRFLVTTSSDRAVRIWDTASNRSLFNLFSHTDAVNAIAFSPDSSRFATVGSDGRIILWQPDAGRSVLALPRQFGPDNLPLHLTSVAFSPSGDALLVANEQGTAQLWDINNGRLRHTLVGHVGLINAVAYSPDGSLLATSGSDRTTRIWNATTGQALYTLADHNGGVTAVAFSPNSRQLATASQDSISRLWQTQPGLDTTILSNHSGALLSATFSPNGQQVATASRDQTANIWDVATGQLVRQLAGHNQAVNAVAFSPNGTLLATASDDWVVRLWEVATGAVQFPFLNHQSAVNAVAFSPDGTLLASASDDTFARIWQLPAQRTVADTWLPHQSAVNAVAFSPNGTLLATATQAGEALIWDIASETVYQTLNSHDGPINSIAFSPDGTLLATASNDGTAKLWNSTSGELLRTFSGHAGAVLSVAFSPDGALVASASVDRTAKVWTSDSGQTVRTLLGHTSTVYSVAFSPDGRQLVTASFDRTAEIITLVPVAELLTRALAQAQRPLTTAECAQYLHGFACLQVETN